MTTPCILRVTRNKVKANSQAGHILSNMIVMKEAYEAETDPDARARLVAAMSQQRDALARLGVQ